MHMNNFPIMFPLSPSLNAAQLQNINQLLYMNSATSYNMFGSLSQPQIDLKARKDSSLHSIPLQGSFAPNFHLTSAQNYGNLLSNPFNDSIKAFINGMSNPKFQALNIQKPSVLLHEANKDDQKLSEEKQNMLSQQFVNLESKTNQPFLTPITSSEHKSISHKLSSASELQAPEKEAREKTNLHDKVVKKVKKQDNAIKNSDEMSDASDEEESVHEDEAYIPNNRRIKKSIESTPKRILRDRTKQEEESKLTPEMIQEKFKELIHDLEHLLEYNDIDTEKLMQLFTKVDYEPLKIITKVKRSRSYYRKYFKLQEKSLN